MQEQKRNWDKTMPSILYMDSEDPKVAGVLKTFSTKVSSGDKFCATTRIRISFELHSTQQIFKETLKIRKPSKIKIKMKSRSRDNT